MHSSQEDQSFQTAHDRSRGGSMQQPGEAIRPDAPTEQFPWEAASFASGSTYPDEIESIDPFARLAAEEIPGAAARRSPVRLVKGKPRSGSEPEGPKFGRRKLVTLLAAGTVGVITVVTVGGISLARSPDHTGFSGDDGAISTVPQKKRGTGTVIETDREKDTDRDGDGNGERDDGGDDDDHRRNKGPHTKPTPSPTQTQTPSPTSTPSPTATPTPAGTVIGSTTQPVNTAVAFTNPADGQASWLVHMSNGNFVAVEQACTHAGCPVKYNTTTGQFNCPCHGAIFNADGTNPQAPANQPLPPVHVTVNANGTITTP